LNRLQLIDIKYRSIFISVISEYSSYHITYLDFCGGNNL